MKVLIGSKNPVKVRGAKLAFEQYFENVEMVGVSVESDVPSQPFNDDILIGARNRINHLKEYAETEKVDTDYFVSIESGITDKFGTWMNINIAIVVDKTGYESIGFSEGFPIPNRYIEEIKANDLGYVMDRISNIENVKQKFGGVYVLTKQLTREDLTKHAFTMALTPFINGDEWKD